jgi:heme A synthase
MLTEFHARLGNTALLFVLALSIWGWWRFVRRQGIPPSYWGALFIAELVILVQGALGTYLWFSGLRPARDLHVLYGLVSALAIPGAYAYTKGREGRAEMLAYSAVTLVLVGLLLRAITTGG